jgi:hypothetical protein
MKIYIPIISGSIVKNRKAFTHFVKEKFDFFKIGNVKNISFSPYRRYMNYQSATIDLDFYENENARRIQTQISSKGKYKFSFRNENKIDGEIHVSKRTWILCKVQEEEQKVPIEDPMVEEECRLCSLEKKVEELENVILRLQGQNHFLLRRMKELAKSVLSMDMGAIQLLEHRLDVVDDYIDSQAQK